MKAVYKGTFCPLHFSCSCRAEKIISVIQRLDLNPHWDSGYTLSASFCRRGRTTLAKALPATPRRENFPVVVAIRPSTLVFIQGYDLSITHVLWHYTFPPTFN